MRLHAHFGMLPLGAFEHCGDKRIKPQGGGGFVGDIVGGVADVVGDVVGGVGDVVGDVVDVVKDAGSWIDDKVNEEIPGGWYTIAAVTGATMGGLPTTGLESSAGAAGAAETGAAESLAGSGFGLSTAPAGAEFGTFNPATISGIGVDTSSLGGMEWLGGVGSLAEGTAGLTAEQISNAALAGSIGSNASSGLGYLGGAESLPSGIAGITGVTSTPITDSLTNTAKNASDLLGGGQQSGSNIPYLLAKGLTDGQQDAPISYNMNQSPFTFTAQQPIQGAYNPQTSPLNISDQTNNLAKLLRNS